MKAILQLALILLLSASAVASAQEQEYQASDTNVRSVTICIAEEQSAVTIEGKALHFFKEPSEELIPKAKNKNRYTVMAADKGLLVDGVQTGSKRLRVRSTMGYIIYKGKSFREDMIIVIDEEQPNRLILVNEIGMESYLYGLINKECLPSWSLEAKKAQAVAARTYAMYRKLERPSLYCDLGHTAVDQVYGGLDAEDAKSRKAVRETHGEVLTYASHIVKSYYHSNCGGRTASAAEVWGTEEPYLPGVKCDYCKNTTSYRWDYKISVAKLAQKLNVPSKLGKRFFLDIAKRSKSGRAQTIRLKYAGHSETMTGEEFRSTLGYGNIRSTLFTFSKTGSTYIFKGRGSGHGVGMCQWGSSVMAKQGHDYREILYYFYPGTIIRRVY